ncbi:MAG: hypothetical protein WAN35_02875 [Terracidiphilus sp.]
MSLKSFLPLLLSLACARNCLADHLDKISNHSAAPVAVVDIEDASHMVVGHLFVPPGETLLLDSDQNPAGGAGFYEAETGEDYLLMIPSKLQFPHLGSESCPCSLHLDKIGWNRQGAATVVGGLRPFLETTSGTKIPIVSDVKHLNLADGRLNFKLQGRGSEYWVLTRYGQVVETGGPWGLWELTRFILTDFLPWLVVTLVVISIVGAIRLTRLDSHPEKSFLQLMKVSLLSLLLRGKFGGDDQPESESVKD